MAKPNAKGPTRTVEIHCTACRTLLLKYRKGGKGALVKCFVERIVTNHCNQLGFCPKCERQFGRECLVRGVPAIKIISGKARMK